MEHTLNAVQRRPGAVGALMDEYERAAGEFSALLDRIPEDAYTRLVDPGRELQSIKDIAEHVVWCGYIYADHIRELYGIERAPIQFPTIHRQDAVRHVASMIDYTAQTLEGRWTISDEELVGTVISTSWGVAYHIEQWLEHAIVHVLRHRRQIEGIIGSL